MHGDAILEQLAGRGLVELDAAGDLAIREDASGAAGGDGRTIEGYAYRWGTLTDAGGTREYGPLREGFAPGAFAPAIAERAGRPWPLLDRHRGTVVGSVTFHEDAVGLAVRGRLLDTDAARAYAATAEVSPGVSLEWLTTGAQSRRQGQSIIHTAVRRIAALAGTYVSAHQGAELALRDTAGGQDTVDPQTTEPTTTTTPATASTVAAVEPVAVRDVDSGITATGRALGMTREQVIELSQGAALEVLRGYAERGGLPAVSVSDPLAGYATLGELFTAAYDAPEGDPLRGYAMRALADTVFTAGANAGLASGNLITSTIARIVNGGRPVITAFGGPRPLGDTSGLTLEAAYFNGTLADRVAAQSAEKAEIESLAVDIGLLTEALVTYAGGSDISYQVIRRGNPSILDAFARITLAAYAMVTDAAAATELETGSVTVDFAEALSAVDLTELTSHFITASLAVQAATGIPAQFVLAGTAAFTKAAQLIAPSSTTVVAAGGMNLRGLEINVGGLPIIHAPGVTSAKFIASNQEAGGWYEDGPFQATADNVALLGRDVAWWGMGAFVRLVPAAIVEIYDVTP